MNYQIWFGDENLTPLDLKFDFWVSESLYFSKVFQVTFESVKKIKIGNLIGKTRLKIDQGKNTIDVDALNRAYIFSSSQNNFERLSSGKHKYSHTPPKSSDKEIEEEDPDNREDESMLAKLVFLVVFGVVSFCLFYFLKRYNMNKVDNDADRQATVFDDMEHDVHNPE